MTTLIAFLFVTSVIVFIHELGHFVMARRCGVRVDVFSLGFGPRLLTLRRQGTDYCVSAIPLGGYVKMAGERSGASAAADAFSSKTKWQRCQILAAGPAANLILAAVIVAVVAFFDAASFERTSAIVGSVVPGSPAEHAGILPGDLIVSVAGQPTATWNEVEASIGMRPHRQVRLAVRRADQTHAVTVVPQADPALGVATIGILPRVEPVVASIAAGGAADRAGLRKGDVITAIDGAPAGPSLPPTPRVTGAQAVQVRVRRDTGQQTVTIIPGDTDSDLGYSAVTSAAVRPVGPLQALRVGIEWTASTGALVLRTLQGLVRGDISLAQLTGPVGIAQLAGEAASISWTALFCILALLSVNIGMFNLLPIPVLDGGRMMVLGLEAVMRRDVTPRARRVIAHTGLAMLLLLTVVVFYNDLARLAWLQWLMGA
jgi:regulator of sigma E protease